MLRQITQCRLWKLAMEKGGGGLWSENLPGSVAVELDPRDRNLDIFPSFAGYGHWYVFSSEQGSSDLEPQDIVSRI